MVRSRQIVASACNPVSIQRPFGKIGFTIFAADFLTEFPKNSQIQVATQHKYLQFSVTMTLQTFYIIIVLTVFR